MGEFLTLASVFRVRLPSILACFLPTSPIIPRATITIGRPCAQRSGVGSSGMRIAQTCPFLSKSIGSLSSRSTADMLLVAKYTLSSHSFTPRGGGIQSSLALAECCNVGEC